MIKKVYLAGPEVFLPNMVEVFHSKIALCKNRNLSVVLPSESDRERLRDLPEKEKSRFIYRLNISFMHEADVGVFNLTPFRGPSADVGTVFELGFMHGLGKAVFGYTNVSADYSDRIGLKQSTGTHDEYGYRDENNWGIESHGNFDNLMLEETFKQVGEPIVRFEAKLHHRLEELKGFALCLDQISRKFS